MICLIICLMTIFCCTSAKEEEKNLSEVCNAFDFEAGVNANSEWCAIAVCFQFEMSRFEGCFNFFNIYLWREEKIVDVIKAESNKNCADDWHEFKDVASGVYNIFIAPICNFSGCSVTPRGYGTLINMSSDACVPNKKVMNEISPTSKTYPTSHTEESQPTSPTKQTQPISPTKEIYPTSPTKETHPTSPINETHLTSPTKESQPTSPTKETQPISPTKEIYPTSTINETHLTSPTKETHKTKGTKERTVLVVVVTISGSMLLGLVFFSRRRKCHLNRIPDVVIDNKDDTEVDKNTTFNIEVYIIHYYDSNEKIKKKVEMIRDFLLKSSYFSSVKGIEDDLAAILFNVNDWLNSILNERGVDGTIRKIILITSQEENEPYHDEIENQVFTTFLSILNNNGEQSFSGYDNLFVVQLDGSLTHCERSKHIRQNQYSLCRESLQDRMIDLCLNLCSEFKLYKVDIEERIRELFLRHPVRHLGNCVNPAEYV